VHLKQKSYGNNSHLLPNKMHKLLSQRASDLNMDLLDVENPIYESKSNQRREVVVQPTNFGALESGG
jgi:hypothetical protein